jgi:hypothetical protein
VVVAAAQSDTGPAGGVLAGCLLTILRGYWEKIEEFVSSSRRRRRTGTSETKGFCFNLGIRVLDSGGDGCQSCCSKLWDCEASGK